MLNDLVSELENTADWRRQTMEEYPEDLRNKKAVELLTRLSHEVQQLGQSEILKEISEINDELLGSPEDKLSYDITALIEECNAYRRSIGFSESPSNGTTYLTKLLDIYKNHQILAVRQYNTAASQPSSNEERPRRVRMQGAESDAFETFCRRYGFSDSVILILGRAFDFLSGYADLGVSSGVQPINVFLSMVERGIDSEEASYPGSLPAALAAEMKLDRESITDLMHRQVARLPRTTEKAIVAASPEPILVLDWAKRLSNEVSKGESVAARHLLGALLAYFTDFRDRKEPGLETTTALNLEAIRSAFNDHLIQYQEQEPFETWLNALNSLPTGPQSVPATGEALNIARQASEDELCLDVDDYADALAKLFSLADDGEFCFAVYGHWGRGKTFLMQRMKRALNGLGAGYHTIHFSAWRYPTAPEVWVHLYETFAKEAFERPWHEAIPNIVRTAIAKRGSAGLLKAYALFAIGLVPLFSLLGYGGQLLSTVYVAVGLTGLIWLLTVIRGVQKTNARLTKEYLTATRHTEKLGLQATIGSDLRALLIGWLPKEPMSNTLINCYWIITTILLVGTWLRLTGLESVEQLSAHFSWKLAVSWSFWAVLAVEVLLILVAAKVINWIRVGGSSPRRIILVVDDLDRCRPEHLLSVMESIKLLIEDPEISRRVQVTMLLEEEILKHAIFEKYGALTDDKRAEILGTSFSADRLMRENCEKLFTASIRLPRLGKSDVKDLVETFSGRRRWVKERIELLDEERNVLQARMSDKPALSFQSGSEPTYIPRMVRGEMIYKDGPPKPLFRPATAEEIASQELRQAEFARKAEPTLSKVDEALSDLQRQLPSRAEARKAAGRKSPSRVLEEHEVTAISAALTDEKIQLRDNVGPRSIRAFLFRYQLARLLLTKLNIEWHPTTLALALAAQFLAPSSKAAGRVAMGYDLSRPDAEKVRRIVEEVS